MLKKSPNNDKMRAARLRKYAKLENNAPHETSILVIAMVMQAHEMTEKEEPVEEKKQPYRMGPRVETRLLATDIKRLDEAAKEVGQTRAELSRQAILWYLDNLENLDNNKREAEVSQAMRYATDQHVKAINSGVDRICKMLARQGRAVGTLYELAWMALPDDDNARAAFDDAVKIAKQKMAKHVELDEQEQAEKMKMVVKG